MRKLFHFIKVGNENVIVLKLFEGEGRYGKSLMVVFKQVCLKLASFGGTV